MKSKSLLLIRTLLMSTDQMNIYRHTDDKKKRKKIILNYVGVAILFIMILGYLIGMSIGYGKMGIIHTAPALCSMTISLLAFIFTFFKTNGYLFNFKEYDMLMSLPFEPKTVAACKFVYMYVKSLTWYLSISVSMLIGYAYFVRPPFIIYPMWIILSLIVPVVPMLIASFLGFVIAKIGSGFKKTNIVQTVFTMGIVLFFFFLRFFIEKIVRNGEVENTIESTAEFTLKTVKLFPPAYWFSKAVTDCDLLSAFFLIAVSMLLFAGLFYIVGRSYRKINSALKNHASSKNYDDKEIKKRSVEVSIAYKELKRMTGSSVYMTNVAIGVILASIMSVIALIAGFDRIVETVTQGAPIDPKIVWVAIPFFVYFFIGMVSTCAITPSLEGKNYWIVKSLPIEKRSLYKGKMLFNMWLTLPFMILSVILLCISAKVPVLNTILYLIEGMMLCAFSSAWGCVCGIKHMRLDWENEIEVIKQSAAVAIYMFPNMLVNMGLIVLVIFLGTKTDANIVMTVLIFITLLLTLLSYKRAMRLADRSF